MQSYICFVEFSKFICSVLSLHGVLTLVSCPIVLSTYISTSHCISDKRLRIEIQPAGTYEVEREKRFCIASSATYKG